jgi:hypothetical protein
MKYAYALAAFLFITPVMADEDGTGMLAKNIMSGLGLIKETDPIKYRERAPLVLPPNSNGNLSLPKPQASASETNAQWPKDNDQKKAPKMVSNVTGQPASHGRKLTLEEMKASGRVFEGGTVNIDNAEGRSKNPTIGQNTLFKGGIMGKEERIEFKGEGNRTSLIQPPSGYRTPSANQPYGPVGTTNYKEIKVEEKDAKKNR